MPHVDFNGSHLYYRRKGAGPALVLLHGLGSSEQDWQYQIDYFSQWFDVIAPDFPLHGRSGGEVGTFSLSQCAEAVIALLDILGIEQATVVGVSMGGMVGLELATSFPSRVTRLCVVNALAECRPRRLIEWWMLLSRRLLLKYASIERIASLMAKQLLPGEQHEVLRQEVIARWSANDRERYIAAFNALLQWDVLSRLPQLTCPLLMLASEYDYTPAGAKKVLAMIYPGGAFELLKGAHHLAPLEMPGEFNRALELWLEQTA